MSKRGRPRLPDNERRDIVRIFLLNEREDNMLQNLAEIHDVSLATVIRFAIQQAYDLEHEDYSEVQIKNCR